MKWVKRIIIFLIIAGVIAYFGLALLSGIQGGHPT